MDFQEYQTISRKTAVYPQLGENIVYPTLGVVGEAGEVAEKVKKIIRDGSGEITDTQRTELTKEIGDVLWYLAQLATELGVSLDDVATKNIEKLFSRLERGVLHGSGDNR